MLENFTVQTFSSHLGSDFRIYPDASGSLDVALVAATDLSGKPDGESSGRPFSIVFRGPGNVLLPQRIYRMEHPEIGIFELFLVPIGPDEQGLRYEAIFT